MRINIMRMINPSNWELYERDVDFIPEELTIDEKSFCLIPKTPLNINGNPTWVFYAVNPISLTINNDDSNKFNINTLTVNFKEETIKKLSNDDVKKLIKDVIISKINSNSQIELKTQKVYVDKSFIDDELMDIIFEKFYVKLLEIHEERKNVILPIDKILCSEDLNLDEFGEAPYFTTQENVEQIVNSYWVRKLLSVKNLQYSWKIIALTFGVGLLVGIMLASIIVMSIFVGG